MTYQVLLIVGNEPSSKWTTVKRGEVQPNGWLRFELGTGLTSFARPGKWREKQTKTNEKWRYEPIRGITSGAEPIDYKPVPYVDPDQE